MNKKFKIPLIIKGKIVPASEIVKTPHRPSLFCQPLIKCVENQIQRIEKACIFDKKNQNIESKSRYTTEIHILNKNSKNKQNKNVKFVNKQVNKMEFCDDDFYDCPICFHNAIDRDINNKTKSNRISCLVNKSHYFYIDDIYFEKYPNVQNNQVKREIDKNKLKFTFALVFGGDNSIFNKKCCNSTIYTRSAIKDSSEQSNTNAIKKIFEINNLNLVVTRF